MTFSIVARSADGQSWGVAVASKFLAVGSAVPAAVAGVGAIATQADANVAYKGQALAHLDDGATASVALQRLLEDDQGRDHRQVGIVDVDGGGASHTGHACLDWAGSLTGDGYAIQGNILAGEQGVQAMEAALLGSDESGPLPRPPPAPLTAGGVARRGRRRGPATGALRSRAACWPRCPRVTSPAGTAGAASRPRCSSCAKAQGTAASTTSRSTCGSTTTPTPSPSWPGCSTSTTST